MKKAIQNHPASKPLRNSQTLEKFQILLAPIIQKAANELIDPGKRKRGQRTWTAEQRAAASARAKKQKPWIKSTGPRSDAGKGRSSLNSYRHGLRCALHRKLQRLLRDQSRFVKQVNATITLQNRQGHKRPKNSELRFAFNGAACYVDRLFSLNKTKTRS